MALNKNWIQIIKLFKYSLMKEITLTIILSNDSNGETGKKDTHFAHVWKHLDRSVPRQASKWWKMPVEYARYGMVNGRKYWSMTTGGAWIFRVEVEASSREKAWYF